MTVEQLQARRAARGMNDPLNVLRAVVTKAVADGAEITSEIKPTEGRKE